jgi:hypothetical protein
MRGPNEPPRTMDPHEKLKLRSASYRVRKLGLPPAMAELLARELMTWEEFGYRLGTSSIVRKAVDEIMTLPIPVAEPERRMSGAVGYD